MELEILTIEDKPQHKEMYLQHITEMVNIKLEAGETYNDVFRKLRERFSDNAEKLEAVEDWISFNEKEQEDQSVFDAALCEDGVCYAVFNLKKSR